MIIVTFVLGSIWYYAFCEMRATKRRSNLYLIARAESSWRIKIMMNRVLLEVPQTPQETFYRPDPVLPPSYLQQRPTRGVK